MTKNFEDFMKITEGNVETNGTKPSSTGHSALDLYLEENYPDLVVYPAFASYDIFTGFIIKEDDDTWNDVRTYYYNSNYDISEISIKETKI